MRINNTSIIQANTFKGLWGAKTYYSPYKGILELNVVDKYYPFQDDTSSDIHKDWTKARKYGIQMPNTKNHIPPFEQFTLMKPLPFTMEEYYMYKAKDGMPKKYIKLTEKDKQIENIFKSYGKYGLSGYKNEYIEEKPKGLFSIFKRNKNK